MLTCQLEGETGGLLLLVFLSVAAALSGSTSEALPCHDAARAEGVRPAVRKAGSALLDSNTLLEASRTLHISAVNLHVVW